MLANEIDVLRRLKDEGLSSIANLVAFSKEKDFDILIMECVEGRDLYSLVGTIFFHSQNCLNHFAAQGRFVDGSHLSGRHIVDISGQLISAMAALHSHGYCHLDLKPEAIPTFLMHQC